MKRALVLLAGPMLLTWGSYNLTVGRSLSATSRDEPASHVEYDLGALRESVDAGLLSPGASKAQRDRQKQLAVACDQRAKVLCGRLEGSFNSICRPPFVLAGDLTTAELDNVYRETIVPTSRALSLMYFDREPDEPICVVLFADERGYRDTAKRIDGRSVADYHGYYIRPDRRLMINATTGAGTLAHELTHALAHFDFPNMPEWFDEGLASLYEESDFTTDNLQLVGLSNWRLNYLVHALHQRRLGSLEGLLGARRIRAEQQAIDYAQARYLCLYLQQRDLLPLFYRKLRANSATDPSGLHTLREVFSVAALDDVDREFRNWIVDVYDKGRKTASRR